MTLSQWRACHWDLLINGQLFRSRIGYILILLAAASHSPCIIDFRETPTGTCATTSNLRWPCNRSPGILFSSARHERNSVYAPRYFIAIGCILLRGERFVWGGIEETLVDRCFDRTPPRHVHSTHPVKTSRTNADTRTERCWFEFVIRACTHTRAPARTHTHTHAHSNYFYHDNSIWRDGLNGDGFSCT